MGDLWRGIDTEGEPQNLTISREEAISFVSTIIFQLPERIMIQASPLCLVVYRNFQTANSICLDLSRQNMEKCVTIQASGGETTVKVITFNSFKRMLAIEWRNFLKCANAVRSVWLLNCRNWEFDSVTRDSTSRFCPHSRINTYKYTYIKGNLKNMSNQSC